jgi:uncharacterized protein (DUF1800 family)
VSNPQAVFYDILVTHAFGNYRDILREVSASPLMGEYLTMRGNVVGDVTTPRLLR